MKSLALRKLRLREWLLGTLMMTWCLLAPQVQGEVAAWAGNVAGQGNVPANLNAVMIAGGGWFSLALRTDGTVAAWGDNGNGQTTVPTDLSNVVMIAAGRNFSLALKSDGTVTGWGENNAGQTNTSGLLNLVAISAGMYHGLGLKNDGTVVAWGSMTSVAAGLSNVVQISASDNGGMALKSDGTVAAWGSSPTPPDGLSNVVQVAAGASHCLALRADGTVAAWGYNAVGQLDFPADLTNAVAVAAANNHSLALRSDGTVVACGNNSYGEASVPADLTNVVAIAAGYTHNLAITNFNGPQLHQLPVGGVANAGLGFVFTSGAAGAPPLAWQWKFNGTNLPGANGPALMLPHIQPAQAGSYSVLVSNATNVAESPAATVSIVPLSILANPTNRTVYSGESAAFALTVLGSGPLTYQWRRNGIDLTGETNALLSLANIATGQSGNYSVVVSNTYGAATSAAAVLTVLSSKPIITAQPASLGRYPGNNATFQVAADGSKPLTYQWRLDGTNLPGATNASLLLSNLTTAQAGSYSVLVSNSVGSTLSSNASLVFLTVVTWGATSSYGLGNLPLSLTNVVGLCAGSAHSVALKADGRVVAWGYNYWGQTNVPASATNVVAIAAALNHTLALRSNGTVVAWGDSTNVPANVTNAVAIAAGDNHNVVLRSDGTVAAWGTANAGTATNVPVGLSNVVAVAAGGNFSAAVLADGRIVRWGSTISTTGMTNIASLSGGVFTLVALKADGKVAASGTVPVPASLSNVVAVAAGRYHALAMKSDGTVTNWSVSPTTPAGLSNLTLIASGENHCLGLQASGPPIVPTRLMNRRVAPGSSVPFYSPAVGAWPLSYQWRLNSTNLPGATNVLLALSNVLPGVHAGAYSVLVTNSFGSATSSVAMLEVTDFGPALNTSNLTWTSAGDAPWFVQTTSTHDGSSALQSGSITNTQTSVVQTTVTGPGTLTFWWKVTSGQLVFQGGSGASASISGTVNWQQKTIYLGSGSRTLAWTLSTATGAGWLDEVTFEPGATAPIFTSPPGSQSQAPGFGLTLSGAASGTPPIGYQWQLNGTNLPGATGGALGISNLQPSNAGIYSLVATNVAGTNHADALVEIGQVAAWPTPSSGQTIVPAGMTNIVAIAQGMQHSLVLHADGTVQAWDSMTVPAGVSNIIAISSSAGAYYDLALKADGTVVAWGDSTWGNTWGQTNVPTGLSNVVAIAAGWYHGMALKSDGTVVAWGGSEGQANVPEGLTNVVIIGAGSFHSLAVLENGNVVVWGRTTNVPPGLTNATAVAAGLFYCTAVRADGRVATWGDNAYGQTNVPASLTNATSISAGWYHAIAVTSDGRLAACDNSSTVPTGLSNVVAVATGYYNNLALLANAEPSPMTSLIPALDANGFRVSLPTRSGQVYRLEYKNTLQDANWTPLPLAPGNGGIQTLTDPTGINSQRFYRVRQW